MSTAQLLGPVWGIMIIPHKLMDSSEFILVKRPVSGCLDDKQDTKARDYKTVPAPLQAKSAEPVAITRSLRASLPVQRREKHSKHGRLDVYSTILTYVNGATSDASGNLPGFFPVSNITSTGGWASFAVEFDLLRVTKVVYRFEPKLGHKTVRSFTPLTATACQMLRVREDPDGAIGSPSVSQVTNWVPGKSVGGTVLNCTLVDPFSITYRPRKPIIRAGAASTLTRINLYDWVDTGDVNSYASTMFVGGITWNVLQAGACPASTDIFSVTIEFHSELAIRAT